MDHVGGFGVMGWVSASDYDLSEPDPLADSMAEIIQHMNSHHKEVLGLLAQNFAGPFSGSNDDNSHRLGFHVRLKTPDGMRGAGIAFLREVSNPAETERCRWKWCNTHVKPNVFLIRDARGGGRNPWKSQGPIAGREVAHQRNTGHHEVCESLKFRLTDSQSFVPSRSLKTPAHCCHTGFSYTTPSGSDWASDALPVWAVPIFGVPKLILHYPVNSHLIPVPSHLLLPNGFPTTSYLIDSVSPIPGTKMGKLLTPLSTAPTAERST